VLLAGQDVLGRALDGKEVPPVHRAQPGEGNPAPVVTVTPALGRVRLVILLDWRAELDTARVQRCDEHSRITDPELDLHLAHYASA
jgi:hypothetical protein